MDCLGVAFRPMTLSPFDVARHWPFFRSHLLLDRQPAQDRALRALAHQQAISAGDPVAMSRARLRLVGLTAGEAGHAWAALAELERAGVVRRYRGSGSRPDVWSFTGMVHRWRVPWRWGGREAEMVVAHCICRAEIPFAARFPGQSVTRCGEFATFRLPPEAHLDFRGEFGGTNGNGRAGKVFVEPLTRDSVIHRSHKSAPSHLSSRGRRPTSSSVNIDDDDPVLRTLKEAIETATGGQLWGEPLAELAVVATRCNGHADALAAELRATEGTKSPVMLARRAGELLCLVQERELGRQWATLEHQRRRLAFLSSIDRTELDDDQVRELDDLLGTMDPGA